MENQNLRNIYHDFEEEELFSTSKVFVLKYKIDRLQKQRVKSCIRYQSRTGRSQLEKFSRKLDYVTFRIYLYYYHTNHMRGTIGKLGQPIDHIFQTQN